jgi:hypothetical protein
MAVAHCMGQEVTDGPPVKVDLQLVGQARENGATTVVPVKVTRRVGVTALSTHH